MNREPLLHLKGASRVFAQGRVAAVSGVTLTVQRGDFISITGPSGSGKSTLLHLAAGLDHPTGGRVLFDGREPRTQSDWSKLRATRIGFVFQSFHLIGGLTAAANVELPMFGVVREERTRRRRVAELLDRVGLSPRSGHRASELSGGECQRVAIARALANSPDLLLADEPTGNLDSQTAGEILALLEDVHLQSGAALVIVTHDPSVAGRARRLIRLFDGKVVSDNAGGAEA